MPFPWKKNRVTRICRIVADLQSPKRGSSLVVQTGFPTSLIDLFVKNRTRFSKPNSKKPSQPQISDPPPPPAISPAPPPVDLTVVRAEAPRLTPLVTVNNVGGGDDDGVAGLGPDVNRVGECASGSGSKSIFAAFVKMLFMVVVLVTSVEKKLTVGMITVSAFALLLLELAGKRFVSKMGIMEPLTQSVSNCVLFQKLQLNSTKMSCEGSVSELIVVGAECSSNSLSLNEIEVVVGPELDCVNGDKKLSCPEIEEEEEGSNGKVVVDSSLCESKGSRSVRFRSQMVKKFVPKKMRTLKKEIKERKIEEICEAECPPSQSFEISSEGKEEEGVICEENRVGDSGYIILFVIALAGLVMGRFSALMLTMAWCFMLKIASCSNARKITETASIKCSVPES